MLEGKSVTKRLNNVTINAVTPRVIETGRLEKVVFKGEGEIHLEQSWIDLILLLVGAIYDAEPNNFTKILSDNKVLSAGFQVRNTSIQHTKGSYMTYGIEGKVYIDIKNDSEIISDSIVKLLRAVGKEGKGKTGTTRFYISPITLTNRSNEKRKEEKSLKEILEMLNSDIDITITDVSLYGNKQAIVKSEQILAMLLAYSSEMYGIEHTKQAAYKANYSLMGACDDVDYGDGKKHMKILGIYFYYEDYCQVILAYVSRLLYHLGIMEDVVRITYEIGGK